MKNAKLSAILVLGLGLMVSPAKVSEAVPMSPTFDVNLPNIDNPSVVETITIPNGRPIYALLVSGYYQNRNLDMFHWYNFAKCLQEHGAYVHYAWWNNLLAPYMERPLHEPNSVPGWYATPAHDLNGYVYPTSYPNKALPAEDYQFQQDATALLTAIRDNNPDAAIILVGHSMGGDAVIRLADSVDEEIEIALLAPIDPVGNRTEMPMYEWGGGYWCCGYHNFKRFYAVREDWFTAPPHRQLGDNIKYLYHRWQTEFLPPFDGTGYIPYGIPIPGRPYQTELLEFDPPRPMASTIGAGSTNVQSRVATSLDSGYDAHPDNSGGWIDGHGEIVGLRGVKPWSEESWALGLDAPHNWPSLDRERSYDEEGDRAKVRDLRVSLLKRWEVDPEYFDFHWAPEKPKYEYCKERGLEGDYCTYCMVSGDLCLILETAVNLPPVADAGPDQVVECSGPNGTVVTLDGSGSTDPNGDALTYEWTWNGGLANGVNPTIMLPTGLTTVTLTVSDGELADSNTVGITIVDTTPPDITCPVDVSIECPADTDPSVTGSATATDSCANAPVVTYSDSFAPGPGNTGVITRTWTAIDASGNTSSCEQVIVIEDTTAPELSVSVEPAVLWPSNHKMVKITASIQVSDTCDNSPKVELVSIISNEPDNDKGDGNTSDDIKGADFGTDDRTFSLRAERIGKDPGRIYTVKYRAMDASGNVAEATAEVTVLHDGGKKKK